MLGAAWVAQGRHEAAIGSFREALTGGRDSYVLGRLGHALALSRRPEQARTLLAEIDRLTAHGEGSHVHAAYIHLGLAEHEAALDALARARSLHDADLNFIGVDPLFDSLREHPRFRALRADLGLP